MLKIKDNIDLKELEKFDIYKKFFYYSGLEIRIDCDTREIMVKDGDGEELFDLIQAGYVEKI